MNLTLNLTTENDDATFDEYKAFTETAYQMLEVISTTAQRFSRDTDPKKRRFARHSSDLLLEIKNDFFRGY